MLGLLASAAWASAAWAAAPAQSGIEQVYSGSVAVVIGIDAYRDLSPLTGAVRDAKAVAEVLRAQGFEVITLLDAEAKRQRISEVLGDELPNRLGKDDRVLIYFAGHGVTEGDGESTMGYLMPFDASNTKRRSTGLSMSEMQQWFQGYKARHVMFVADACYSGLALSTRSAGLSPKLKDYVKVVSERPVRLALVAGGAGEEANEWHGHGLFTTFFLDAIRGAADTDHDGIVTSYDIVAYVRPQVTETALGLGARQTPQYGRRGEGEFLFFTQSGAALVPGGTPLSTTRDESFAPVDLAPFANGPLDWVTRVEPGVRHFAGVPFTLLGGDHAVVNTRVFGRMDRPTSVAIPVGGVRASKLHVLVSGNYVSRAKTDVGALVITYASGRTREVRLRNNSTIRETWLSEEDAFRLVWTPPPPGVRWQNVYSEKQKRDQADAKGFLDLLTVDLQVDPVARVEIKSIDQEAGVCLAAMTFER